MENVEGRRKRWRSYCRKGLVDKEVYLVGKRDYRRLCKRKKEEWNKELLKKAREAKTQEQIEGGKQREEKKG